ncbi:allophanate hydrolase [Acinetobacter colistiniresistens]|uniref:Allophanate hydrolase n=1 Tax=Acinetobacter colistiniresistens TaxID=280145 RepID=S3TQ06_9GAMM|nr:allophanate hydrolase [Acinetobacter colistiniresistens]EPG37775.1 allophanate hydrolase [Acinetobacter colistiniresistens]TVT77851.1 allophanate hydrolase [Acinetobacter colistiniresistens]
MSELKTLGWTISEWQTAYSKQEIQLDILKELVAAIDPNDVAWISVASSDLLQQQIQSLTQRTQDTDNLQKQFPLYGIPFAVKDNIDVAGFVTTAACKALTTVATQDAETVRLLKQAGAIVIGKTNLDQFATGLVGTRSPFGAVPNSFKPEYVSGGSSSGSASVVARGLVPFSLGTDTAGSGRIPAGFNNIVGLKPTKGRFSNRGLLPAVKSIDCISIFALTVADAEWVAAQAEAYDALDSYSRQHPKNVPARFSSQLKFAIPNQLNFFGDVQAEKAFLQTIQLLESFNAEITPIDFSAFEQLAAQLYQGSWVAERTAAVENLLTSNADDFDPTVLEIVRQGEKYSAIDAYNAEYLRLDLARKIQDSLAEFDALIVPTSPTIYTIEQIQQHPIEYNAHFGTYTNFTNLADLSALALPAGFRADNLPFGITLIAPAWHDAALVHFGKAWQNYLSLKLGALDKTSSISAPTLVSPHHIRVAVVGAHLTGMPLNFQLTTRGAVHVETTKTSQDYALYALNGTVPPKPGLARQQEGQNIIVELWDVPTARFGEFVAEIPTPLGMGNVELEDGRWVKGFICEPYGLGDAENISHFGGWRAYIQHRNSQSANAAN